MQASVLAAAGLLLDIAGAVVLGYAVFVRRAEHAVQEASQKYDFNADLHVSLARQTADAQAGLFLFVVGFFGQFLSAIGVNPTERWAWLAALYAAVATTLLVLAALVLYLRPRHIRAALFQQLTRIDPTLWPIVLRQYGAHLGKQRGPNDSWADFGRDLLGTQTWALVTRGQVLPDSLTVPGHEDGMTDQDRYRAFQA